MQKYKSIGSMIKRLIKCRNRTIKEVAALLDIKNTTFSAQLQNDTVSAETLFRLAVILDLDLNWMMMALGYHGTLSSIEREMTPRMSSEFRRIEAKNVEAQLDEIIRANPSSTSETRVELLKRFSKNMFYLLDVLVPEDYNLFMITERGKQKFYVDIPAPTRGYQATVMRRKSVNSLYEGSKVLDLIIEERRGII